MNGFTTFFRKIMAIFMVLYMTFVGYITGNNKIPDPNDYDLTVTLSSNPSTGCTWEYEFDNEGVIELKKNVYIQADTSKNLVGSGGTDYFCFEAVGDGNVTITFTYGQHWDGGTMFTETVYECAVADGEINVRNYYTNNLGA